MARSEPSSPGSSVGGGGSRSGDSYAESGGEGGASEVTHLARRVIELTEEGLGGVGLGQHGAGGETPSEQDTVGSTRGGEEDQLRRSVREALSNQRHE